MTPTRDPAACRKLLADADNVLLDCDGVLWRGDELTHADVPRTIERLRGEGKRVLFVTNNSTKTRADYIGKFTRLGIACCAEDILSSGYMTACFLKQNLPAGKRVYVVGTPALCKEIELQGIEWCGGVKDAGEHADFSSSLCDSGLADDASVGAVVVSMDFGVSYLKLCRAFVHLQRPDCLFVATNMDANYPTPQGFLPGSGSIVASVMFSTGRTPVVCGKPEGQISVLPPLAGRTVMVGDREDTDMSFGRRNGFGTLLVLTGVSRESALADGIAERFVY